MSNAPALTSSGLALYCGLSASNSAANGFEALKDLDSNNDGKIDNQDTNFNNLKIWQDKNSDGKLDEGELLSLAQAGVHLDQE
jgi:Ca2+-binding EF-hand superfamily protein